MVVLRSCLRALSLGVVSLGIGSGDHDRVVPPGQALARLKAGNARFAKAIRSAPKPVRARRLETANAQHPYAIVVGCSDSRTVPEFVFDTNLGELFIVRVAGNVADSDALASIEYAVAHLGSRLIVVLGHEHCGAVKAALSGEGAPGHIGKLLESIRPAVEATQTMPGDRLTNAIRKNAGLVAQGIRREAELGELGKQVEIVSAFYDFDTGKVEFGAKH
jgi:carbonic anhydrase